MDCPNCNKRARVIDTASDGDVTYRQYKCTVCETKFMTSERIDSDDYKTELNRIRERAKLRNIIRKSRR